MSSQNTLAGKAWYRPDLTRSQVTAALRNTAAGAFLIRESTTQPGCYALAMHAGGGQPWNGLITPSVDKSGRTQYGTRCLSHRVPPPTLNPARLPVCPFV